MKRNIPKRLEHVNFVPPEKYRPAEPGNDDEFYDLVVAILEAAKLFRLRALRLRDQHDMVSDEREMQNLFDRAETLDHHADLLSRQHERMVWRQWVAEHPESTRKPRRRRRDSKVVPLVPTGR